MFTFSVQINKVTSSTSSSYNYVRVYMKSILDTWPVQRQQHSSQVRLMIWLWMMILWRLSHSTTWNHLERLQLGLYAKWYNIPSKASDIQYTSFCPRGLQLAPACMPGVSARYCKNKFISSTLACSFPLAIQHIEILEQNLQTSQGDGIYWTKPQSSAQR